LAELRSTRSRAKTVLLVPAAGGGDGIGHLERCLRLARALGRGVTFLTVRMDTSARAELKDRLRRWSSGARPAVADDLGDGSAFDLVLLDARRSSPGFIQELGRYGPVIGLDEGGNGRACAAFLIDAIPGGRGRDDPPNVRSIACLDLPPRSHRTVRVPFQKVLVTFGGEDRDDLCGATVDLLIGGGFFRPRQIHLVEGPLFARRAWPDGVEVMHPAEGLRELLPEYDLVFTHFGLTALEAAACGVPVILLNPSTYHARLAAQVGLPSIGVRRPDGRLLGKLLNDVGMLRDSLEAINATIGRDRGDGLARMVGGLTPSGPWKLCPVCSSEGNRVVARFSDRTWRRCSRCGIYFQQRFSSETGRYQKSYFFSEYRAQYGRTYLQDFQTIREACRPRVEMLRRLLPADPDGAVVDVGCAYGPFLSAARDAGLAGYGLDVFEGAVRHVREKLGIPAITGSFETVRRRDLPRRIAAITFWYVIEHFSDIDFVLDKTAALLPTGGVLAFSTPNYRGISGRRSLRAFLERSPIDHVTILSPHRLSWILSRYGLVLRRVRVTGHHPERFPGLLGRAAPGTIVHRLVSLASRALRLGDTFEAYAVKGDS